MLIRAAAAPIWQRQQRRRVLDTSNRIVVIIRSEYELPAVKFHLIWSYQHNVPR